jgi:hypothetical protein
MRTAVHFLLHYHHILHAMRQQQCLHVIACSLLLLAGCFAGHGIAS